MKSHIETVSTYTANTALTAEVVEGSDGHPTLVGIGFGPGEVDPAYPDQFTIWVVRTPTIPPLSFVLAILDIASATNDVHLSAAGADRSVSKAVASMVVHHAGTPSNYEEVAVMALCQSMVETIDTVEKAENAGSN
jgi:hypothetical protein